MLTINNRARILDDINVKTNFHPETLIPIVQEIINIEKTNLEANKILNNLPEYIENEYRVTQAEMLLSLLRRSGDPGF